MGLETSMCGFTLSPMYTGGVQIMNFVYKNQQTCVWAGPADTNEAPEFRVHFASHSKRPSSNTVFSFSVHTISCDIFKQVIKSGNRYCFNCCTLGIDDESV